MSSVIGFAHRGAPVRRSGGNTLPAFRRALELGAGGLETDIGLTSDGVPILRHAGISFRRERAVEARALPPDVPTLQALYGTCGTDFELSLDMARPDAVDAVVRVAAAAGALDRLWLTYWRVATLREWRRRFPGIHLVYPTLPLRAGAASRLIGRLAGEGIDVLNVHHRFCRARLVDDAHAAGLRLFAWGIRSPRSLPRVVALGVDGVYCDHVEGMVATLRAAHSPEEAGPTGRDAPFMTRR